MAMIALPPSSKNPAQILGDILTRFRVARSLTRAEVADRVGSKRIAEFEAGEDVPDSRVWARYRNMVAKGLRTYDTEWRAAKAHLAKVEDAGEAEAAAIVDAMACVTPDPAAAAVLTAAPLPLVADAPTFAEALRRARAISGLSASDVGDLVGVTESSIHNWEGGRTCPVVGNMTKLVELFSDLASWSHVAKDMVQPPGWTAEQRQASVEPPRSSADITTVLAMVTENHETIAAEPHTPRPRHDQWYTEVNPKPLPALPPLPPVIATPAPMPVVTEDDAISVLAKTHTDATLAWVKAKRERVAADAAYRAAADARDRANAAEQRARAAVTAAQQALEAAVEEVGAA